MRGRDRLSIVTLPIKVGGTLTKLAFKHGHRDSLIPRVVSNVQKCWDETGLNFYIIIDSKQTKPTEL